MYSLVLLQLLQLCPATVEVWTETHKTRILRDLYSSFLKFHFKNLKFFFILAPSDFYKRTLQHLYYKADYSDITKKLDNGIKELDAELKLSCKNSKAVQQQQYQQILQQDKQLKSEGLNLDCLAKIAQKINPDKKSVSK